jgi:DNA-directed RNA polymerase subunit RPC12/RpoP
MLTCSKCGTDIQMTLEDVQKSEQVDCYGCGSVLKSRVDPTTAEILVRPEARVADWDLVTEVGEGKCSADWCERRRECPLHTECADKHLRGFVPALKTALVPTRKGLLVQTCCHSHSKMSNPL